MGIRMISLSRYTEGISLGSDVGGVVFWQENFTSSLSVHGANYHRKVELTRVMAILNLGGPLEC